MGQDDQFSIADMNVGVARSIHWWPEQSGIGGAYDEFTEIPDPDHLFIVPHGGTLSFLLQFPNEASNPSILFQDSLGPIDADDSSGEDYQSNLERLLASEEGVNLWLTCVDCADTKEEFQPYLDIIQPQTVFAIHFDGLSPDIEQGLQESFQEPSWYRQSLMESGAEGVDPDEYFDRFELIDGRLQKRQ